MEKQEKILKKLKLTVYLLEIYIFGCIEFPEEGAQIF
jgi:hypothetical protein